MWEKTGRPSPQSPKGILGLPSPYGHTNRHAKRQNKLTANSQLVRRAASKKGVHQKNIPVLDVCAAHGVAEIVEIFFHGS